MAFHPLQYKTAFVTYMYISYTDFPRPLPLPISRHEKRNPKSLNPLKVSINREPKMVSKRNGSDSSIDAKKRKRVGFSDPGKILKTIEIDFEIPHFPEILSVFVACSWQLEMLDDIWFWWMSNS